MVYVVDSISSFPLVEQIKFIASYHNIETDSDKQEVLTRGYSPEQLAIMEKMQNKGFDGFKSLGIKFSVPLKNFKSDIFYYVLTLNDGFEKGMLPFSGSMSEQPAQIIEKFSLVRALKAEAEEKRIKKQNAEAKKQKR